MQQRYCQQYRRLSTALLLACASPTMVAAEEPITHPEIASTQQQQKQVSLTVYNNNVALISDQRALALKKGANRVAFTEVSAQIRPETARLESLSGLIALEVIEQNFEFDLLSPNKLLEKYVGQQIGLVRTHPQTGAQISEKATLLSMADQQPVFKIGKRIEIPHNTSPWRYVFPSVPANLRDRPTLTMDIRSAKDGNHDVDLTYLTGGISWQADYVAKLNADDSLIDLSGWVTLNNRSGSTYQNARIKLVAGDVQLAPRPSPRHRTEKAYMASAMVAPAPMPTVDNLFEYYLYTMPHPSTVADQQSKQLRLLQAVDIPVQKIYRLNSQQTQWRSTPEGKSKGNAATIIAFKNDRPSLGRPLPAGVMRFFKQDKEGQKQFIGENRIQHTPTGEQLELKLGNAFDITAERVQLERKKLRDRGGELSYEITLRNAKELDITVEVIEAMPGDWTLLDSTHAHTKLNASQARWQVSVPAKGETKLSYRVNWK